MAEGKKIKRVLRVGRVADSSLSSFVERPVPTEKEVATFERVVNREMHEQEIDSNLNEIYSDHSGKKVDVSRLDVKKRAPFIVRLIGRLLVLGLIAAAGYFAYSYWFSNGNNVNGLELKIIGPDKAAAGEELTYRIEYHNPTKYALSRLRLEAQYPGGFIYASASQDPTSGNYGWDLPDMEPGATGKIEVKGMIIGTPDSVQVLFANLSYVPGTFSSQYRQEASVSTIISGPGFTADLSSSQTAFVNQDNEMSLILSEIGENYLGDFNISFAVPAEASASVVETAASSTATGTVRVIKSGGATWQVSGLSPGMSRVTIPLKYRLKQKVSDPEIKVRLEKKLADGQSYVFWEKAVRPELVDSDLNLTLLLGGEKNDTAVGFGQPLEYTVTYDNRGSTAYKDVVIMAVLQSDFLDWGSLKDDNGGQAKSGTIVWTKNEVPALGEIKPGQSGQISFRINTATWDDGDLGKDLQVAAYAQYGMNGTAASGDANKSNTVSARFNSDLSLAEKIRYFNDDNVPVGSGPLPPRAGEKTSVRVYWTVTNNLHELAETRAVFTLPSYVSWEGVESTNVGNVYYDGSTRQVIWEIGRLPISVYRVGAEFSISVTPGEGDRNKILILSPGSVVTALDTETKASITKKTSSKTTKLEDDDIAGLSNSGIVQ